MNYKLTNLFVKKKINSNLILNSKNQSFQKLVSFIKSSRLICKNFLIDKQYFSFIFIKTTLIYKECFYIEFFLFCLTLINN